MASALTLALVLGALGLLVGGFAVSRSRDGRTSEGSLARSRLVSYWPACEPPRQNSSPSGVPQRFER